MKMYKQIIFFGILLTSYAYGESFLTAQSFPKTFQDLSFTDKMAFLKDVYEPYAPEYDDDGYCVKNCAYPGLHIKQEEKLSQQNTEAAVKESENFEKAKNTGTLVDNRIAPTSGINTVVQPQTDTKIVANMSQCSNRNPDIPSGQKVPKSEPLMGKPYITSQYGPRVLNGKQSFHDGLDYRAAIGTFVYAPADGRVVFAGSSGNCGNGVQIQHEDGTKTIYCHLDKIHVYKGDYITSGCAFAETGNTGHSTGPHLHYAMKDSKGNKINPAAYTKRGTN